LSKLLQGRVLRVPRTLLVNKAGLEHAKGLVAGYKQGKIGEMNAELWNAKKIVDSTLHPGRCCWPRVAAGADCSDTGEPVFLPFRMSCFVLSNLIVTAGMLTPGLGVSCLFCLLGTQY
jgi:sideroflexin-5